MPFYDNFNEFQQEILRQRARRIANPIQKEQQEIRIAALQIFIQGEQYLIPMQEILSVYENIIPVPVPCTPAYVAGIANIRGHIIPILDLARILSLNPAEKTHALLVASNAHVTVGFMVERIGSVINPLISELKTTPDFEHPEYLKGIWPDGTVLLDIQAILKDEKLVVKGA